MRARFMKGSLWLSAATLLILTAVILQGCVVFLTSVATVVKMRGDKHHTTTVLVKKSPATVYAAINTILERRPDVEVLKIEEEKYLIEARRGENRVTAKTVDYGSGLSQIIVTADAGEGERSDEDLALDVIKMIVEELGVAYRVIED